MTLIDFLIGHSRKAILSSLFVGLLSGACSVALLAVINIALKTSGHNLLLIGSFAGLCLLQLAGRFTSELLLAKLGQEAMYRLRQNFCQQILGTPLVHLERLGASRLLTVLTDDIQNIITALNLLPMMCISSAIVIGCLVYMAVLSLKLFASVLIALVVGIAAYQIPIMRVRRIFDKARSNAGAIVDDFRILIQGIKELKIHRQRREAFMQMQLQINASSFQVNNVAALRLYSIAATSGQAIVFIVVGIYLFILPTMEHLANGVLTGYILTLLYIGSPLQMIMNNMPQFNRAHVALRTVRDLGFRLAEEKQEERPDPGACADQWQRLDLKSVTHSYIGEQDADMFVLGPIDVTIETGELVFITGGNGSGKTTLIKLIAGLYVPGEGCIEVDGRKLQSKDLEWYRQHFSVVFADFCLFQQLLGIGGNDVQERAEEYLKQLRLAQKVSVREGRLSTITELSQGQRKRLALLTAYLENRQIYIFDEWAADQDIYFRELFYMHLLPELKAKGKTVLVISHDDRYYEVADRIIKLDEGRVVSDSAVENAKKPCQKMVSNQSRSN